MDLNLFFDSIMHKDPVSNKVTSTVTSASLERCNSTYNSGEPAGVRMEGRGWGDESGLSSERRSESALDLVQKQGGIETDQHEGWIQAKPRTRARSGAPDTGQASC
jgi:hypothetical protein